MFTGLIQSLAEVADLLPERPGVRLVIREPKLAATSSVGDSIAINGCCLTVVDIAGDCFAFQAGEETLSRTNLGELTPSALVNLEQSLRVGDALGGHYVTGHIDGVGTVKSRRDDADWCTIAFNAPAAQLSQMASKGSVAVDGVSLTLVEVENELFTVALIPHTLAVTTLGRRQLGDRVNIETDVLAKYVQRHLSPMSNR
jgi:riboflavin synthase